MSRRAQKRGRDEEKRGGRYPEYPARGIALHVSTIIYGVYILGLYQALGPIPANNHSRHCSIDSIAIR